MEYLKRLYNYVQKNQHIKQFIEPFAQWYININCGKKWKETNLQCLDSDMVVEIKLKNKERKEQLDQLLRKPFHGTTIVKKQQIYKCPAAIIKIPNDYQDYLKLIGSKSRNMLKKVERQDIEFHTFDWNSELDNIYEIHTSLEYRQGRRMDDTYLAYPSTLEYTEEESFSVVHLGAFFNDKLVGYIELYIYGNFAITNRIIGHKEYLSAGIMNGLIAFAVQSGIDKFEYLNYLSMQNCDKNSLSAFKYRVGFREYAIMIVE